VAVYASADQPRPDQVIPLSDESSYITGAEIAIDGALSA
jgi:hypothetical protein